MSIQRFEDILAWQKARVLVRELYWLTEEGPFAHDFGLRDQVRRAGISIMANVAEGFDAGGDNEFIRFLRYALRSTSEVQSLLYIALDVDHISQEQHQHLYDQSTEIKRLLAGFIRYLIT